MTTFASTKVNELLARMDSQLKTRYMSATVKHLVFKRLGVLKSEGYVEDVAFSIALREHNFTI